MYETDWKVSFSEDAQVFIGGSNPLKKDLESRLPTYSTSRQNGSRGSQKKRRKKSGH